MQQNTTFRIKEVENYDRYFVNKDTGKSFRVKAGSKLKGDYESYEEVLGEQSTFNQEYFKKNESTKMSTFTHHEKLSLSDVAEKARNYDATGLKGLEFVNNQLKPLSEAIKNNATEFLNNSEENSGINENVSNIVNKIRNEAKKMIPSKIAVKVESSKHISKMFNLSDKRQKKLNISKKSISVLQQSLDKEKIDIASKINAIKNKIEDYSYNIKSFGDLRDQIEDIIQEREYYVSNFPQNQNTNEEKIFVEEFIKESEKIITLLLDVNGYITSTNQRKKMFELNLEAFAVVLNNLDRVDSMLIPTMIGEYESYVANQNLSKSTNFNETVLNAIDQVANKNTSDLTDNVKKAYNLYNSPVHNIESMLKRQSEILSLTLDIDEAIAASRERNTNYIESISLINESSLQAHDAKNKSSVKNHLDYLEKLKNKS